MQPRLRFKTLSSESKIFETNIGDVATIRSGSSPSNFILRDSGLFPFLKVEELNNCQKYQQVSRNYTDKNKGSVPKNSIIFPKRGAAIMTNKVRITSQESLLDSNLMALIPITEKVNYEYLYQFLVKEELHRIADTSSIPQINNKHIEPLKITLPSLIEQGKIASFLSAVDEKISQLTKKHELLTQYKKGVMQKIFSQELRFKANDGAGYPDWEEVILDNILDKNSLKNKGRKHKLVQSVSNKYGFINQDELFEDRRIASKDTSNYYVIGKNCFAYNPSRIDVGSLAYKSDELISVISPLYISFYAKREIINDYFLLNWFSSEEFTSQMNSSFEGSVRNTLSYESLTKISITYPCLTEQTKIASFLSAIDDKIQNTQAQLESTKQYKQGLLQQMFV